MSLTLDLYGFSSYDTSSVDTRHQLLCYGCPTCEAAEAKWERDFNRNSR